MGFSVDHKRIRCLYLTTRFPYPTRSGYDLRVWNIIRHLNGLVQQTIVCRVREPLDADIKLYLNKQKIKLECFFAPRPKLLIKLFIGLLSLIGPFPLCALVFYSRGLRYTLNRLLNSVNSEDFDLICIEGSWLGIYWNLISKAKLPKIVVLHNIEEEVLWRESKLLSFGPKKLLKIHDAIKMRYLENRILKNAELIIVTSERDRELLLSRKTGLKIEVIPNGVACDEINLLPPTNQRNILFVGTFSYFPNIDAVLYFSKNVFPSLRAKFKDLTFFVVGENANVNISMPENIPGIKIIGTVKELTPYYQNCTACVIPLRAGGGTRLKILEAMAYGRPVVSTSIGCEGLNVEHKKHLLIADEPKDIIESVSSILNNQQLADYLVKNARVLIEDRYSWDNISKKMYRHYLELTD